MRLGIISDTHGHVDYTTAAIQVLQREQVDVVIHCGDIGTPQIPGLFAGWPTHFVFGNVDHDQADLRMAIHEAGLVCHDRQGEVELGGRHIAFLHGDDSGLLMSLINSQAYDLVCYGHTHEQDVHHDGRTIVLNPGAVYRASPHTIATVELDTLQVSHVVVEQPPLP